MAAFKMQVLNLRKQILAQNTEIVLTKGDIESSFQATWLCVFSKFTVEVEISVVSAFESGSQQVAAVSHPMLGHTGEVNDKEPHL